jgi:hypothetical protein
MLAQPSAVISFSTKETTMPDVILNIRAAVAAHLVDTLPENTRTRVINHYAEIEAGKQATALIAGIDKLTGFERDLQKIRPQNTMFDEQGAPVGVPTFTKQQVDDRKKLQEQIDKLSRAITKADDAGDFGDLYNLVK